MFSKRCMSILPLCGTLLVAAIAFENGCICIHNAITIPNHIVMPPIRFIFSSGIFSLSLFLSLSFLPMDERIERKCVCGLKLAASLWLSLSLLLSVVLCVSLGFSLGFPSSPLKSVYMPPMSVSLYALFRSLYYGDVNNFIRIKQR